MKSYPMFISKYILGILLMLVTTLSVYAQQHTVVGFNPKCSYTNETVTITGTNFTGVTDVRFGNTSAQSFTVVNNTTITAVVGAGATGAVTVVKAGFTSVSSAGFTFFNFPTVTSIATDFGGYWNTNTTNNSLIFPNNSHNLLSFKYAGTTYSTGVNDNTLNLQGVNYVPGNFKALPALIPGNIPASPANLFIVAASNFDGNPSLGIISNSKIQALTLENVLSDGINGLDLGTGYTNMPTNAMLEFVISSIDPSRISDNEPDIVITQIAEPTNTNSDNFVFKDANGDVVGNAVQISIATVSTLGTYRLDLFNVTPNTPYTNASPTSIGTGANVNNTTRNIRFVAFRLSDFGINASNYNQIKKLEVTPSGISDVAFMAYNANAINLPPSVTRDPSTSSVICSTGVSNAFLKVDANASIGGALSYQWQLSTDGGTVWNNISNDATYSGATSDALTITGATVDYKYRAMVHEVGVITPGYSPVITITAVTGAALGGTLNPTTTTNTCVKSGTPSVLSVSPTGGTGTYSYQWQASSTSGTGFVNIDGATNRTFTVPVDTAGTAYYRVVVTSGCYTNTSNQATVNVTGGDIVTSTNAASCTPGTVTLSATATTGEIRWYATATSTPQLATGATYTTPSLTQDSVFFVNAVSGTCSSPRIPVRAIIASNTSLNATNFSLNTATNAVVPAPSTASFYSSTLPVGSHRIYYHVVGANTQNATVMVSVDANGIGSFTTEPTVNVGTNTLTIDSIDILNTNGCAKEPPPLNVISFETTSYPLVLNTSSTPRSCNVQVGVASASSTNGVAPYTYAWSGPNGYSATTASISNLASGNYTVTITDVNNRTGSAIVTVDSLSDVTAPVPNEANLPTVTGECSASVTAPTATDNCGGAITATTNDPLSYNAQGTYTITWTYDDGNGNTSTQTQTVIVDDITAPVADVASLPTVTGECSASVTAPTATDNCGGAITATTNDPLSYTAQGTYTITWTYDDGNGNTSTQTQTVVIDNVTAPVADNITLPEIYGQCSATVITTPTATANCGGKINGTTNDPLSYTAQGTYNVTWTYDDGQGNTSTQTQVVVVKDTLAPVPDVANLSDATGECSVTVTPPTATDNCAGVINGTTNDPLSYTTQGTYTITWTYDDGNGNTSTQTQTVVVDDNSAPVPNEASLPTVTGECTASVTAPIATDNCAGAITATTNDPLTYNAQGTYTITWTYDDGNGNTSTQTQTVIVDDNTAPVANVASLPNVTGQCSATVTAPTATDNCAGAITATTNDPLSYNAQGTYTITWTYNDGNGNTSTQTQTVIVNDNTAPTALCKNHTVTLNAGTATITTANINNGSSDNCGIASMLLSKTSFNCDNLGANTVTLTVIDANNNQSTCTSTVTVNGTCSTISCGINPIPSNNIATGAPANKVFLGYGPQSVTLNSTITNGPAVSYSWSPSTNLSCTTCANPVWTPNSASSTTYTLTVTSANGQTSTCTITMCAIEARAWILYGYGKNNVNANKVVVCHLPPGNPANMQTICISVNAVPAHVPLHGGDFLGPCGAVCGVNNARPIDEFKGELLENEGFETIVYPNPTSGEFSIMINSESLSPITGFIFDMTGKKVMEINDIRANVSYPVNAPLAKGIYFLKLEQDGHNQSVRLIKD